jgi:hypothetical protein
LRAFEDRVTLERRRHRHRQAGISKAGISKGHAVHGVEVNDDQELD